MPYPMNEVIQNTLCGISKAQIDYQSWSGYPAFKSPFAVPEYLMTTYIAKEIFDRGKHSHYITLEHNTARAVKDAGGQRRGRPRHDLRPKGRFDILLWYANGYPRAIIEVKRQVNSFNCIEDDVNPICSVLDQKKSIRHGIISYIVVRKIKGSKEFGCKNDIESKMKEIRSETWTHVKKKRGMKLTYYFDQIRVVDGWSWVAGVILVSGS